MLKLAILRKGYPQVRELWELVLVVYLVGGQGKQM